MDGAAGIEVDTRGWADSLGVKLCAMFVTSALPTASRTWLRMLTRYCSELMGTGLEVRTICTGMGCAGRADDDAERLIES